MEPLSFAALALVAFLAAVVQASTGFGFAILAVPFFLFIMGSLAAIQITAVTNFVISLVLMRELMKDAPKSLLAYLIAGSFLGFPLGLAFYRWADLDSVKLTVGLLITAFAFLLLARELRLRQRQEAETGSGGAEFQSRPFAEFAIGIVSGAMAVALAMPGPVVVLYLLARHAGKTVSRAATLLLFAFSYGASSLVHGIWGGMTAETWKLAGMLIPVVIAGAAVGHYATRYLSERYFRTVVLAILIASGLYGMWSAL